MSPQKRASRAKRTNMRFKLVTQAGIRRIKEIYGLKTDTEAVDLAVYYLSVIGKQEWLVSDFIENKTDESSTSQVNDDIDHDER